MLLRWHSNCLYFGSNAATTKGIAMTSTQPTQPIEELGRALVQAATLGERLAVRHRMLWGRSVDVAETPMVKCWAWFNLLTKEGD